LCGWKQTIEGGTRYEGTLAKPVHQLDYYRHLAVFAFPVPESWDKTSETEKVTVTTSLPILDLKKVSDSDSWEAKSQNWSPVFRDEFRTRRGYDLLRYLPAVTGVPIQSADITERFLLDFRRTTA
jgi:alpha-L-rhamnosidase